jgi:hypothetical protein
VTRIAHVLVVLAVIAVPVLGWFVGGWSGATTLAVYWFETVAGCLLVSARALVHQRISPRYGHFRYNAPESNRRSPQLSSFVGGFTLVSMAFCVVHAVFLGAILLLLQHNRQSALVDIDWRSVGYGCLLVFVFLVADFAVDLVSLRRWSFQRLEQLANRGLSRVIVVHLTLIFGFLAIALTDAPDSFFGVFVVLKTLAALSSVLPQYEPATAPRWLSNLMNRVPNVHPGERFEDFWAKDRKDETARREHNERPWVTT